MWKMYLEASLTMNVVFWHILVNVVVLGSCFSFMFGIIAAEGLKRIYQYLLLAS